MQNKQLRILIFDCQHFRRLYLEKIFNCLGYYRVVPISSYDELVTIIQRSVVPIDLVCYNALDCKEHNGAGFFCSNDRIEYLMPYNDLKVCSGNEVRQDPVEYAGFSLLPDFFTVRNKMEAIESASRKSE